MTTKLKVKKSLALEQFCKSLVVKGVCEIKELVDYESQKMSPQLVTDMLNFVEEQTNNSKWKGKFDKKALVLEILVTCFSLSDEERALCDNMIQHDIDNNLIRDRTVRRFFVAGISCLWRLLTH